MSQCDNTDETHDIRHSENDLLAGGLPVFRGFEAVSLRAKPDATDLVSYVPEAPFSVLRQWQTRGTVTAIPGL